MKRNLKVLGLALVAVLAMSAVAVASASAATIEIEGGSGTVKADQVAGENHVFTVEGNKVECEEAHFESIGAVSSGATEATVHPTYKECTAFGFVGATVDTGTAAEGCNYTLHAPGTEEAEMKFAGELELTCTAGKKITITASTCTATVEGPQTFTGVTAQNTTVSPMDFMLNANVSGIKTTKTKDGFLCPFNGTGAVEGSYTGNTTVRAYNGGGTQVGITVK